MLFIVLEDVEFGLGFALAGAWCRMVLLDLMGSQSSRSRLTGYLAMYGLAKIIVSEI